MHPSGADGRGEGVGGEVGGERTFQKATDSAYLLLLLMTYGSCAGHLLFEKEEGEAAGSQNCRIEDGVWCARETLLLLFL